MTSSAAASSVSLKDLATTGVAVAASLAALYSVLSLSVRLDLAQDERDRRRQVQHRLKSRMDSSSRRSRRKSAFAADADDQLVDPDQMGDSALLPDVPPPSLASTPHPVPPSTSFLAAADDASASAAALSATDPDSTLLRVSQLDQPTLDSELARTDAKLRRLLKRKEKLELRRNQLSVAQLRSETTPADAPPLSYVDYQPSITPSVAGATGAHVRPLTPDERALFGLPGAGAGMPMPPSAEGRGSQQDQGEQGAGRARRESLSTATSASAGSSDSAPVISEQSPGLAPLVSSMSSEHNELDAAAATSSSSSSSATPEADVDGDDFVEDDDQADDDDSDVLSSISDASAGMESVVSDTSLGSDFSFLSDARYGLFHQHG